MKAFREYLVDKHETSRAGGQDVCISFTSLVSRSWNGLGKFPTAEITDLIITEGPLRPVITNLSPWMRRNNYMYIHVIKPQEHNL